MSGWTAPRCLNRGDKTAFACVVPEALGKASGTTADPPCAPSKGHPEAGRVGRVLLAPWTPTVGPA